jgi:hypothetical protein
MCFEGSIEVIEMGISSPHASPLSLELPQCSLGVEEKFVQW